MANWRTRHRRRRTRAEDWHNNNLCQDIEAAIPDHPFYLPAAVDFVQSLGLSNQVCIGNLGTNLGFYNVHGDKGITLSDRTPTKHWPTLLHELSHAVLDEHDDPWFPIHGHNFRRTLRDLILTWEKWIAASDLT
jgi:hypothetical protein